VIVQSMLPGDLRLVSQVCHRGPDALVFARNRFSWGLFSGTKNDLREPTAVQTVTRQMNLHAGFSLNKIRRYIVDISAASSDAQGLYLDRAALAGIIERMRADRTGPHGGGYHGYLYNAEPTLRPLWDAWADRNGRKARELAAMLMARSRDLVDSFVNGHGIYSFQYVYWHGGLEMTRDVVLIAHLLAYAEFDPAQLPHDMRAQLRSSYHCMLTSCGTMISYRCLSTARILVRPTCPVSRPVIAIFWPLPYRTTRHWLQSWQECARGRRNCSPNP
jgi:hypothetical protein